jgi:hypothetical protein
MKARRIDQLVGADGSAVDKRVALGCRQIGNGASGATLITGAGAPLPRPRGTGEVFLARGAVDGLARGRRRARSAQPRT